CTLGMVVLEADVTIGSNVDLISGRRQHAYSDPRVPIQTQARQFIQVRVGRNSWVGNSAVVLSDVGPGCVLGAGTVVVRPLPAFCMAAGNPARVKKKLSAPEDRPVSRVTTEYTT